MEKLEKDLGSALRPKEVAEYLGLDEKTVRLYYQELGGMRLGRNYLFFERRMVDAIQKRTEVDCPSEEVRDETREGLSDQEGGFELGNQNEAKTRKRLEKEDRHGLFRRLG